MSAENRSYQDKFMLRLPDGMRERIKAVAEKNGRSMNAEIVRALENAFPEEPSIDEIANDITNSIRIIRLFKGNSTLMNLADQLDYLISDLSRSSEGGEADRKDAKKYIEDHGKFVRYIPPKGSE